MVLPTISTLTRACAVRAFSLNCVGFDLGLLCVYFVFSFVCFLICLFVCLLGWLVVAVGGRGGGRLVLVAAVPVSVLLAFVCACACA